MILILHCATYYITSVVLRIHLTWCGPAALMSLSTWPSFMHRLLAFYLPMQKSPKTTSRISSKPTSPVMQPSCCTASRSSSAIVTISSSPAAWGPRDIRKDGRRNARTGKKRGGGGKTILTEMGYDSQPEKVLCLGVKKTPQLTSARCRLPAQALRCAR